MPKTCKQFCKAYEKKYFIFQKKLLASLSKEMTPENKKKFNAAMKKSIDKHNKQIIKRIADDCKKQFCNKTCKNTILEAGRNKYPPLSKDIKSNKELEALITKMQKDTKRRLFGDKDNVLKDGFYEKLSSVKVNKLKKNGATSACVEMLFKDFI